MVVNDLSLRVLAHSIVTRLENTDPVVGGGFYINCNVSQK